MVLYDTVYKVFQSMPHLNYGSTDHHSFQSYVSRNYDLWLVIVQYNLLLTLSFAIWFIFLVADLCVFNCAVCLVNISL